MQIMKKTHNLSKQNNQVHAWHTEHNKLSELSKLVKNLCPLSYYIRTIYSLSLFNYMSCLLYTSDAADE